MYDNVNSTCSLLFLRFYTFLFACFQESWVIKNTFIQVKQQCLMFINKFDKMETCNMNCMDQTPSFLV